MGPQEDGYKEVYLQVVGVAKWQKLEFKTSKVDNEKWRLWEHYKMVRYDETDYDIATQKKSQEHNGEWKEQEIVYFNAWYKLGST